MQTIKYLFTAFLALALCFVTSKAYAQSPTAVVTLNWDAPSPLDNVIGFKLMKKGGTATAPTWTEVATIAAPNLTFDLTGASIQGTYTVVAYNANGVAPASNEVVVGAPPAAVKNLRITIKFLTTP